MSSDPTITPPPTNTPDTKEIEQLRPRVKFSGAHWFFTGIIRVSYRQWTHVAARLFPEGSKAESIARKLHIPLPDQLNMSWVTSNLAVGGRIRPADIHALARSGVTHVIDTRSEYQDDPVMLGKEHIELLYLPTPDTKPLSVEQMMEGAKWANERMEQGGNVLIHCEHGVGRSVLLTCAVLVYGGMHAQDALRLVQQKRWQAAPNHKQIEHLRQFEAALDRR
ncbi:MAG TPA: dual specificity protein phosphatase [Ktedonobacteraceae bacterium]|nr:dual specificity protein phosphatase [Ktedonobacteraceae bacterium]